MLLISQATLQSSPGGFGSGPRHFISSIDESSTSSFDDCALDVWGQSSQHQTGKITEAVLRCGSLLAKGIKYNLLYLNKLPSLKVDLTISIRTPPTSRSSFGKSEVVLLEGRYPQTFCSYSRLTVEIGDKHLRKASEKPFSYVKMRHSSRSP